MAGLSSLKPPEELSLEGDVRENFKRWKQKFEIYMEATGIKANEDMSAETKVAILLHVIGSETLEIYNTLEVTEEVRKDWTRVITELENYFMPRTNETVIRHMFNMRIQKQGESIDSFVTDLKKLSKDCNFGDLKESLIRDRIVCGVLDQKVRERLLRESTLDLENCIKICKAAELAEMQTKQLTVGAEAAVQVVRKRQNDMSLASSNKSSLGRGTKPKTYFRENTHNYYNSRPFTPVNENCETKKTVCNQCGKTHFINKCPAFRKMCMNCHHYNHFAKMCHLQKVDMVKKESQELESKDSEDEHFFVGSINHQKDIYMVNTEWKHTLILNGVEVNFKLDTGAQVNILDKNTAIKLNSQIKPSILRLRNYNGSKIQVFGQTSLKCTVGNSEKILDFQVVDFNAPCVLGLPTIEELSLIKKVNLIKCQNDTLERLVNKNIDLFSGIGQLDYVYNIKLKENVCPVVENPRKIPISIEEKVKSELDNMENLGIIRKVTEPTEWVNSMVIVKKPDNTLRICLDPQNLNRNIVRERHQLPTFEELSARMPNASVFSILDGNKGFYQIKLSEQSELLTTFNAGKLGRYCYRRVPYGLSSAPEVFHRCFKKIFEGIPGVEVYIDDIIVWGTNEAEHEERLKHVLDRARRANVRFNRNKCRIGVNEVRYVGHIFTKDGLKPDNDKVSAILSMDIPQSKKDLQTFLGMVTYVSKFIPNMSDLTFNLRSLLKKNIEFLWQEIHTKEFQKIKDVLTTAPVLKYYDINEPIVLSVDSSSKGLGAVILQNNLPVAYASKALTESQKSWAQIEKELLAIAFGCEKFHQYIFGRSVVVESDHKPLEYIFKKPLHDTPLRLQRLRLRLQNYDLKVVYKPGKDLLVADALSRNFESNYSKFDHFDKEVEAHVSLIVSCLPISNDKMLLFQKETATDAELQLVISYVTQGWPCKDLLPVNLQFYYKIRNDLFVANNLLFKNACVVVPKTLRKTMLDLIHLNHFGIEKSKNRARQVLFWPYMNKEIEDLVKNCRSCLENQKSHSYEPLMLRQVPEGPWQVVGTDIFYYKNKSYLLLVDYYSKFIEVTELPQETTDHVIAVLKSNFARYGIPLTLYSDGGPQYSSYKFSEFCRAWHFIHRTSSPYYARSNGMVERYIQTFKNMLKKCDSSNTDPYVALLEYRNTPIDNNINLSPSQIMFGRNLNAFLPTAETFNSQKRDDYQNKDVKSKLEKKQSVVKHYHDLRHGRHLPDFDKGDIVYVKDSKHKMTTARVEGPSDKPRSFRVTLPTGNVVDRNKYNLYKASPSTSFHIDSDLDGSHSDNNAGINQKRFSSVAGGTGTVIPGNETGNDTITRSGRVSKKPIYLNDYV